MGEIHEWLSRIRPRAALLVLLIVYCGLGLVYWLATPIYEGPDEPMHYAYVRHLVETGHLPPVVGYGADGARASEGHPAHQETSQPPLYYAVAAGLTFWAPDQGDYADLLARNPHFSYPAPPTVPDNKNTWLHTPAEDFPWRGTVLAVRLTRLVSLLFGALGVVATWGLGRELWPTSTWLPLLAAGVAAGTPQFVFASGLVSNDAAAMALSACVLWCAAATARRGVSARLAMALGVLLGLAGLSKLSVLGLIPLVGLLMLATARRDRLSWRATLVVLGLTFGVAALVGGWWYARNWLAYGDPFNTEVHRTSPWAWDEPVSVWAALAQMGGVERSFWGVFGAGNVGFPDWIYTALRAVCVLAVLGWVVRRHSGGPTCLTTNGRRSVWMLLWAWLVLILALQVRWMQLVLAPWGRLLFPALAAIACLLVEGWRGWVWVPSVRPLLLVPVAGLLLLSAVAPPAVICPAYARPAQLTAAQVAARAEAADFRLGDLASLIGYRLDRTSLPPGDWLTVTTCWEVVGRTDTDYTLFVQLLDVDGGLVASRHTYPGQGRFLTSQWRSGDRFCDETRVHVGGSPPAPAVYRVEVGLLDAKSGTRLPVTTAGGPLDGPLVLTRVRVGPASLPDVAVPVPLDYGLGDALALVGRGPLPEAIRAGEVLSLTVYWQATAAPPADYTAFVHLLDPAGEVVAQVDRPPRNGWYPTSFWMPGEVVTDTFDLPVPASASPGEYRLVCGMYAWPDLARLPVLGADGQPQPDSLAGLGSIEAR